MSSGVFASRNVALGFAGLVIVLALFAPTAINMLVPHSASDPADVEPSETVPKTEQRQPRQPEPTWADEPLADDWNADSVRQSNGFSGWASGNNTNDEIDESPGDYAPASPAGAGGSSTSSGKSRKTQNQGVITSRAQAGAPSIVAPGKNSAPAGQLTVTD